MTQIRLLPLAGLVALVALVLLWTGQGGRGAQASVFSVTPAGNGQFLSGTALPVSISAEANRGMLTLTASGATDPKITVTGCSNTPPLPTPAPLVLTPQATAPVPGPFTTIFYCTGTVTGDGTASVTIDTDKLVVPAQPPSTLRVTLTLTATCGANTPVSLFAQQQDAFQQTVTVAASPEIVCTVPSPALTFASAVNPASVGCGGRAAVIFSPNRPQPAQTLYFVTTTGSVAPPSVDFSGSGGLSTFFTAPLSPIATTATVTLQTAAGLVVGSASLTTNCGAAVTATAVPAAINTAVPFATPAVLRPAATSPTSAPQAAAPPAVAPLVVISPPNTGDGGMLSPR